MEPRLKFASYAIILLLVGATFGYVAHVQASPSSSQTAIGGQFQQEKSCTFYVFTDGTNYYAQHCDTGAITYGGPNNNGGDSGTNAQAVIQSAINAAKGTIWIGQGTYTLTASLVPANYISLMCQAKTLFQGTNINLFNGTGVITHFTLSYCNLKNLGTTGTAINLATVQYSRFENFNITGNWDNGIKFGNSGAAMGAYNQFFNMDIVRTATGGTTGITLLKNVNTFYDFDDQFFRVRVQGYTTGWAVYADRNTYINSIASTGTTGWSVTGKTGQTWIDPLIESLTTGFSFTTDAVYNQLTGIQVGAGVTTEVNDVSDFGLIYYDNTVNTFFDRNLNLEGNNLLVGKITNYGNIATAGKGVEVVYAATSQKTESALDNNVLTYTPPGTAGTYEVCFTASVSAANTATLGWTATWTDSNGHAQAPTNLAFTKTGVAAPVLTIAAAANDAYTGCTNVDINNAGTNIVVKLTFTGTSFTAKVTATIEQTA